MQKKKKKIQLHLYLAFVSYAGLYFTARPLVITVEMIITY
jgi:hypothetical protein